MITQFLGKPIAYWIELQAMVDANRLDEVIAENAKLRAKVHKYEEVFDQLRRFQEVLK